MNSHSLDTITLKQGHGTTARWRAPGDVQWCPRGVGFIFGSSKDMSCRFEHPGGVERYSGTISKFGIDIGITGKAYMRWAVLAPRTNLQPGALEGGAARGGARLRIALSSSCGRGARA